MIWLTERTGKMDVTVLVLTVGGGPVSNLKPFDFSLFSDKHLVDLETQLREEIKRRRELAQSYRQLSEKGGPAYRNPSNSAETWTGRGRKPKWVREALARGVRLEDLTINPA
ncbi:MAG: H-NS family nucleoid-associated regulatory protein [Myxococcota bacterium]